VTVETALLLCIPVLTASIAGTPGYLAYRRTHRQDEKTESRSNKDAALAGFEQLLEELREELDRRSKKFKEDLAEMEAECTERIDEAVAEWRKKYNILVELHNKLDLELAGGNHQVERIT